MKRSMIDYRDFRLSRIREPQYSHLLLLIGWIVYFSLFFLTENLIPAESCHVVHCALDDMIPFREEFVVFYCFWFLLVFGSLLFYLLYDQERFIRLQVYIMFTQAVAMVIYIFWPSIQNLRPETFPRENFFTWVLSLIYAFDTPTGVCPSLHVAYSMGIASTWLGDRYAPKVWKVFVTAAAVIISISTMFVKQHSAVDVFAAVGLGLAAEIFVRIILPRPQKQKTT